MYFLIIFLVCKLIKVSVNCEYDNGSIENEEFINRKWPSDRFEDLYIFSGDMLYSDNDHSSLLTSDVNTLTWSVLTEPRFLKPSLTLTNQVKSLISASITPSPAIISSSLTTINQSSFIIFLNNDTSFFDNQVSRPGLNSIKSSSVLNSSQISSSLRNLTLTVNLPSSSLSISSSNVSTVHKSIHSQTNLKTDSYYLSKSNSTSFIFKPSVTLEPSFYSKNLPVFTSSSDSVYIKPMVTSFMLNVTATLTPVISQSDSASSSANCQKNITKTFNLSKFLIRSVLVQEDVPTDLKNVTKLFESRLKRIFDVAYQRHLAKLGINQEKWVPVNSSVQLWNIFWNNFTNELHIVYQIEVDKQKLNNEDAKMILGHITKQEMTNILGSFVSTKAEPYIDVDLTRSKVKYASKLYTSDWFALFMVVFSLLIFLFCLILTLLLVKKKRNRKKNLSLNISEISKIKPKEQLINWRKVSNLEEEKKKIFKDKSATIDSNHEFEYVSFDSPQNSHKNGLRNHFEKSSKSLKSDLNLNKEKVVQIGDIIDYKTNTSLLKNESKVTYVTTKEATIGDYLENKNVPELIEIQINQQTESIIKAIKSELKKFNPIVTYTLDNNSSQA